MVYSTGADLSKMKPEALLALYILANLAGHDLGVYQATEGTHQDPRHAAGLAADINEIDHIDIGTGARLNPAASEAVEDVAKAAKRFPAVRQIIWPGGNAKSSAFGGKHLDRPFERGSYLWRTHQNHIHVTFYGCTEVIGKSCTKGN